MWAKGKFSRDGAQGGGEQGFLTQRRNDAKAQSEIT
jgi:hypothetical protein